jgi:hypothetical protein
MSGAHHYQPGTGADAEHRLSVRMMVVLFRFGNYSVAVVVTIAIMIPVMVAVMAAFPRLI